MTIEPLKRARVPEPDRSGPSVEPIGYQGARRDRRLHGELDEDGNVSGVRCVHLASLLRALQAAEVPERGIEIVLETDEALVVSVDALLLTSAVGNLLHVAVKFSGDGTRVILRSAATETCVYVEVEDGCASGASTSEASSWAASVRGAHGDGVGFWLAATRRLAVAMNGSLGVEHRAGVGCTFTLELPIESAARASCA